MTTSPVVDTSKRVVLDYTSRDYKSIRSMLVGLAQGLMPDWETVGETGDFGTLLLELYAYSSDIVNYYVDRVGSEAFLGTAVRRQSVLYISDMFGYRPMGQRAAAVPLTFTWQWDTDALPGGLIPVFTYNVVSAKATNGLVTMGLTSDTYAITINPGQTITVADVGDPFDGRFVVVSTAEATPSTPFQVTYRILTTTLETATISGTPTVSTGSVVILPAQTTVTTSPDANGQVYAFETDTEIVLDTDVGRPTAPGATTYTVGFQGTASEGTTVPPYLLGTSQGIPNAEFVISDAGVVDRTVQVFTKEGGAVVPWARVDKMALATPTQSVFSVFVDDQNYTHVLFGDNTSGRIPPVNCEIYVGYRFGAGAAANTLGINTITNIVNDFALSMGVTTTNTSSPTGGADVESIESMRFSIPRSNALKQRAVTLEDFISLALQVPGVTKATAYGANYTSVYIRISASAQSVGYVTTGVTGKYVLDRGGNPSLALLTVESDFSLTAGGYFDLDNCTPPDELDGTVVATDVWRSGDPVVTASAVQSATTCTVVATAHGLLPRQPVSISGMGAPFDGTHVISQVLSGDQFQFEVAGSASLTVTAVGSVTPVAGFSFDVDADTTPQVWESLDPTLSAATSVDPSMQELINSVEAYMADKKLIGSVVYAEPVEWTDADVLMNVQVRPLYNRTSVLQAVEDAIEDVFAYDNVDFGRRISIGDVYRAALAVDGVDYITISRLAETTGFDYEVVKDINGTEDYVLTITGAEVVAGVAKMTTLTNVNFKVGDPITITGMGDTYDGEWIVSGSTGEMQFEFVITTVISSPLGVISGTVTKENFLHAYRIPRLNPNRAEGWVTANGGLANT